MSGTASVPNSFANAVTATGAQLDANYNTLVAYINDPTNRNNYVTDSGGATNTVVLSFAPAVVGGYTSGLELTWKWGATNTGAVVMNANGLGNANLVNPDGSALAAGQGSAGSIGKAVYDGTRFIFISSGATPATAAQVSAAVTLVPYVSPGRMQNHPGVSKAWAYFNGTATGTVTALASYNIASIVRGGTGTYSIVFSTAMASTAWAALATPSVTAGTAPRHIGVMAQTTTSCVLVSTDTAGGPIDCVFINFDAKGSQ
jgi:hypothetical protein